MSKYLVFSVVAVTLLVHAMSSNAMAVAFPEITSSFGVSLVLAGWILIVFQLTMIVSIPISAKASDGLGRKRTFICVVLVFTVGSFLCAIAPNIYWLIIFRAVQGAGAGGFITSASGIISDTFPENRQRFIGFITTIMTMGAVLGPNVGGWLTQFFGWKSIFWLATPWGIGAIIAAALLLKPDRKIKKAVFDIKGAVFFACALVALMIGLTSLGEGAEAASPLPAILSLVIGVGFLLWFIRHERGAKDPMIDMGMLRGRSFNAANIFNLVFGIATGAFVLLPLYAVSVYGVSTIESGLTVTPRAVGMMGASIVTSFLLARWGYRKPMIYGTVLMIIAALFLALELDSVALAGVSLSGAGVMLAVVALSGIGHGLIVPAANNACIELMPDKVSTITGLRQTIRNIGHALGIAVATIVLEKSSSLASGFQVFFFGMAVLTVITIPFALAMPRSPSDKPSS